MAPTILDRMAVRGAAWIVFLGRLAIAALYVPSGFNKLVHLGSFADSMAARSVPAPMLLAVVGAAVEFLGSLAILVGFRTRYAALVASSAIEPDPAQAALAHKLGALEDRLSGHRKRGTCAGQPHPNTQQRAATNH